MSDKELAPEKTPNFRLFCVACSYASVQILFGIAYTLWSPLIHRFKLNIYILVKVLCYCYKHCRS